jgi:hypothetical protein
MCKNLWITQPKTLTTNQEVCNFNWVEIWAKIIFPATSRSEQNMSKN